MSAPVHRSALLHEQTRLFVGGNKYKYPIEFVHFSVEFSEKYIETTQNSKDIEDNSI